MFLPIEGEGRRIRYDLGRSEGLPRTGYFILVRDGVGVGDVGKFFRRRRRRRRRRPPPP